MFLCRFVITLIGMLTQVHHGNELSLIINSGLFPLMHYVLKETGINIFYTLHTLTAVLVIATYIVQTLLIKKLLVWNINLV